MINEYIEKCEELFKTFDCNENYYIKNVTQYEWRLVENKDHSLLTIWKDGDSAEDYIVIKKQNKILHYMKEEYSMIIAIDCIKVAFILKNVNRR